MRRAEKINGEWVEKTPRQFRNERNAWIPDHDLEAYGLFVITDDLMPTGKVSRGPIADRDGRPFQTWMYEPQYASASAARAAMVQWIDRLTAQVMSQYPVAVQTRWHIEEAAARAVKAGTATTAQLELVSSEGTVKGRTPEQHADAIVGHADRFHAISAEINKLFLATDAALEAATDPAQYEAIFDAAMAQAAPLAEAYGLSP